MEMKTGLTKKNLTTDSIKISGPYLHQGNDCEKILRNLPDWFGIEEAIVNYKNEINQLPTFIAQTKTQKTIGFISLKVHFSEAAEIYVMGINPEFHRRGIGERLVLTAQSYCKSQSIRFLQVKTLSPGRESKAYNLTRNFYRYPRVNPWSSSDASHKRTLRNQSSFAFTVQT
jgi:N-acetylglutamate synthase-like GNAT family acetyltransferase